MKQSAILLQSGDHPQPRKMFNICDKNLLSLRPPSDEQQQQHLRVGRRECVGCLFNDPSSSSVNNNCLSLSSSWSSHPRKDHEMIQYLRRQYIYNNPCHYAPSPPPPPLPPPPQPPLGQRRRMFSGEDETFGPPGGGGGGCSNIYQSCPQSAIVPYYGVPIYEKGEEISCILSLGRGYSRKGKEPIVSSASMVGGCGSLATNFVLPPPSRFSLLPSTSGGLGVTDNNDIINNVPIKNKRKRKYSHRNMSSVYSFPTNVKNLLSTGIFEGVPVKYVSWSRVQSLKGIIKGTNYLCSCDRCKMNMAVNAYEFEKHAGCDTKHPNNHIYFPSGKSLYSVVQELKGIIQNDSLFEAIRTASGTPINIKNFKAWKALYESASNSLGQIQ